MSKSRRKNGEEEGVATLQVDSGPRVDRGSIDEALDAPLDASEMEPVSTDTSEAPTPDSTDGSTTVSGRVEDAPEANVVTIAVVSDTPSSPATAEPAKAPDATITEKKDKGSDKTEKDESSKRGSRKRSISAEMPIATADDIAAAKNRRQTVSDLGEIISAAIDAMTELGGSKITTEMMPEIIGQALKKDRPIGIPWDVRFERGVPLAEMFVSDVEVEKDVEVIYVTEIDDPEKPGQKKKVETKRTEKRMVKRPATIGDVIAAALAAPGEEALGKLLKKLKDHEDTLRIVWAILVSAGYLGLSFYIVHKQNSAPQDSAQEHLSQ